MGDFTAEDYAERFAELPIALQRAIFHLFYEVADSTDQERRQLEFIYEQLAEHERARDEKSSRIYSSLRTLIQTLRLTT